MGSNTGTLHLVVTDADNGLLFARVVELKIVVTGSDLTELVDEVTRAIRCHYEFAQSRGLTPFATLFHEDADLRGLVPAGDINAIELPAEVAMALATALHVPKPTKLHIQKVRSAA